MLSHRAYRIEEPPQWQRDQLTRRGNEHIPTVQKETSPQPPQEMTPEDAAKKKKADKKDRQRKKKALEKAERVRQEEEEHLKLERKAQKSRTPEPQDMESLRIRNA